MDLVDSVEATPTNSGQAPHEAPAPPPTVRDLYKQAVLRCLEANNTTWAENAFLLDDYPSLQESADALRHLVVRHLLKECGDAECAASILDALSIELGAAEDSDQKFYRLLCRYTAEELKVIASAKAEDRRESLWANGNPNDLSLALWGDDYIERFDQYCVKSLAAEGNVPALKAHGPVRLLIHTATRDVEKIRGLESLQRLGIELRIWAIPDELLASAKGDMKYWLLGAIQSIHLFHAARTGANFLPVFPDALYSARYFESLLDLARAGNDAVFLSGFRASREKIAEQLEQYSKRDAYAVPGARLVELALRHVDPYFLNCFIDPLSESLPRNRVLFANGGDRIEVRAPHYNPAFVRNSIIKETPPRYLMTLDSEIDKILPPTCLTHFHTASDDYFATELVSTEIASPGSVTLKQYADYYVEHANAAHLRFQRSAYHIAIQPEWLAGPRRMSADEAQLRFDAIWKLVEAKLAQAPQFERPHVAWLVLKDFAAMDVSDHHLQLLAPVIEAARLEMIALARREYDEGRFVELDSMVAPLLKAPQPPAEALLFAGHCRHHLGLRKEALDLYRKAEVIDPNLPELRVSLAAFRQDEALSPSEQDAFLPGFSLPRAQNIEARRFLDRHAAPHLSTLYTNDNMIVFQRALTFLQDPKFMRSLVKSSEASPGTVDDRTWRVHILLWAMRSALNLEGDFVELGTFRAFFAGCIVDYLDFGSIDRKLYLFDTFAGLPDDAVFEKHLPESFYSSLKEHYSAPDIYDSVRSRFADQPNVMVVQGKLPDTLHQTCPDRIAWLHIDLNSAKHEVASLEFLWDRITIGGFIILDDYGFAIFSAQTQAHQVFFQSKGHAIAELPTGQGLVIKTHA